MSIIYIAESNYAEILNEAQNKHAFHLSTILFSLVFVILAVP